jgi:predicted ATPase
VSIRALPSDRPPLVGRERELGVLRQRLDAALAGYGSLVLIAGEAGIGKSALADAMCQEAEEQDALVLTGRCFDLTETPPYGPWLYLFSRYRPSDPLPPHPTPFAQSGVVGEVASRATLFNSVLDFFRAVSDQTPLVVLLDDLHWADSASLDLLRFLAQSLATLPMLLIATYRSDELTRRHPLYSLLPLLVRESHAERIDVRALTDADVQYVVAVRYRLPNTDTDLLVTYLRERAEGNPFFVSELLRTPWPTISGGRVMCAPQDGSSRRECGRA